MFPLQIARLQQRLATKKIELQISPEAISYLADVGYDPLYGARPVKRAMQTYLETPLAQALLRGDFVDEDTIAVDAVQTADETTSLRFTKSTGASLTPKQAAPRSPL